MIDPVDPSTLEALPGFEPIPTGDWSWGETSQNGQLLALLGGDDDATLDLSGALDQSGYLGDRG